MSWDGGGWGAGIGQLRLKTGPLQRETVKGREGNREREYEIQR